MKRNPLDRWLPILLVSLVLGAIGLWFSTKLGYPGLLNRAMPVSTLILSPLAIGLMIGVLLIGLNFATPPSFRIPQLRFPESVIPYTMGGIFEEVLFRLFLLPLVVWGISFLLPEPAFQNRVFWGVAILLGVVYLVMQLQGAKDIFRITRFSEIPPALWVAFIFASGLGAVLAAYYFRLGGFVASFSLRVGIYVVWLILWGAYAVPAGLVPDRKAVERGRQAG